MFKDHTRIKEESSLDFPHTTINHMIDIVKKNQYNDELLGKLRHIEFLETTDINKANRWFGYYQRVGEQLGYWTLDDVIKWVREEKNLTEGEIYDILRYVKPLTPSFLHQIFLQHALKEDNNGYVCLEENGSMEPNPVHCPFASIRYVYNADGLMIGFKKSCDMCLSHYKKPIEGK